MSNRKIVTKQVDYLSTSEFDGKLSSVLERIQELIKLYGPDARLNLNEDFYYEYDNSPSPRYEIYISREETDDELKQRLFFEAEETRKRNERELAEFERLSKKFGAK